MSIDQTTLLEKIIINQQKNTIKVMIERILNYQTNDVIYHSVMKCLGLKESK
jgi:hypothetical protein